ncbi:MAG TPA: hypothetical protein VJ739_15000 [Gemmataceae bacterium]|nr:hypothetical protein [Gemmataceae bacterium]
MPASRPTESDRAANLEGRYAALHADMVAQYERYVALGGHWALYVFLGWEHLAACAASYWMKERWGWQNPWAFAALWLVQVGVALGAVMAARRRTPARKSPLQRHVDRTWTVFLLLCWNVAILNVLAGQPVFVFLPVLATLSSFAFLVLSSILSWRFLAAALVLCVCGGLIARFPAYGFLIYGGGWLVVLEALGVVFFRKRKRWLPAATGSAAGVSPDRHRQASRRAPSVARDSASA